MPESTPIQGHIVRIIDGHTVILNVGREAGVEAGMRFGIYTPFESIVDPATGDDLGSYRRRKAVVIAREIAPRFCVAEAPGVTRQVVEQVGGVLGLGTQRTRKERVTERALNVAYEQIQEMPTGDEVRVKDIVEQVIQN